jgi:hypothetical protein
MPFITLTHKFENAPESIYVNIDQICWVGRDGGTPQGYAATLRLTNGSLAVVESVAGVMQLIEKLDKAKAVS